MAIPNFFPDNFPQKDWYKFGRAKNGHSKFFSNNFSQKDWYKFRMAKNDHSKFFPNNFSQKDWYKFGTTKNGHSEFFLAIFPKKTGINSEWPKMAILTILAVLLYWKCLNKFRMPIFGHSDFTSLFGKNCWKKFGMAIVGCFKFFLTIFLYILL